MVAGDILEGAREFPFGRERRAQGLVINADDLRFEVDVFGVFLGGTFGDFHKWFAEGLQLDEDADVVDQAREEGFIRKGMV